MNRSGNLLHTGVVGPLSTLLVLLSVAGPLVERADFTHQTVLESEHSPSECPTPHDHTVCTQIGSNQSAPGVGPDWPAWKGDLRSSPLSTTRFQRNAALYFGAPARAPPVL